MERSSAPKLEKVSKASAIPRSELHARLRSWVLQAQDEDEIGDTAQNQGRTPWVWIRIGERHYRLHADTKARGVREYLALVDQHGDERQPARAAAELRGLREPCGPLGRRATASHFFYARS